MVSGEIPQVERISYVWQCTVEAVCGHVTAKMVIQITKNIPGLQIWSSGNIFTFQAEADHFTII